MTSDFMPECFREVEKEGVQSLHRMEEVECAGKSIFFGGAHREKELKGELLLRV